MPTLELLTGCAETSGWPLASQAYSLRPTLCLSSPFPMRIRGTCLRCILHAISISGFVSLRTQPVHPTWYWGFFLLLFKKPRAVPVATMCSFFRSHRISVLHLSISVFIHLLSSLWLNPTDHWWECRRSRIQTDLQLSHFYHKWGLLTVMGIPTSPRKVVCTIWASVSSTVKVKKWPMWYLRTTSHYMFRLFLNLKTEGQVAITMWLPTLGRSIELVAWLCCLLGPTSPNLLFPSPHAPY